MPVNLDLSTITLMDALDLAILIEAEASERYKFFAKQLGHRFPGDAASFFRFMAENEEKHGRQLYAQREKLFGDKPMRMHRDDLFDVEAPDVASPTWDMSPMKACEVALQAEEKALGFYKEALEHVTDEKVRELFTELCDEEVEHIDLVKGVIAKLPAGSDEELEDLDE